MARIHWFEFEDLEWFPVNIRKSMTDYLGFVLCTTNLYEPAVKMIGDTLKRKKSNTIVDLASGNGGVITQLFHNLREHTPEELRVILTDKYPNTASYHYLHQKTKGRISYISQPVDVMCVNENIKGLRTLFSAFHHFEPNDARRILRDAAEKKQDMLIFDGSRTTIVQSITMLLFHPFIFFLCTPFIRPFRFSRLFFTYLLPLIPLCTIWDGLISMLRLYSQEEAEALAREMSTEDYTWKAGELRTRIGIRILYLAGEHHSTKAPAATQRDA